jgi:aspartate aminotransferase
MTSHTSGAGLFEVALAQRVPGGRVSATADQLLGSEILKIAAEIRGMRADGAEVCNLTVGDFDPREFRIPKPLEDAIEQALRRGETNYPPSNGIPTLREAVRTLYERDLGITYATESVLITAGSRPGIYGTYRTIVDPGDVVVYAVPSWNNYPYCQLAGGTPAPVVCSAEDSFLPTRAALEDAVRGARMLVLNSPLNPAGTSLTAETLADICDLVLEENARRGADERPLYLMYDQVYWMLTFGATRHVHPVALRPAMQPYTIYVDGISKGFAATGVRVGWVVGPADVIRPMNEVLGHVGAWAPRAEQVATAQFLGMPNEMAAFRNELTAGLRARLDALYDALHAMRAEGLPVDSTKPTGTIYLSARFALIGRRTRDGEMLRTNEDIRRYLLREAGFAAVPFQAFGSTEESGWFRLSVGAVSLSEIAAVMPKVRTAVAGL